MCVCVCSHILNVKCKVSCVHIYADFIHNVTLHSCNMHCDSKCANCENLLANMQRALLVSVSHASLVQEQEQCSKLSRLRYRYASITWRHDETWQTQRDSLSIIIMNEANEKTFRGGQISFFLFNLMPPPFYFQLTDWFPCFD